MILVRLALERSGGPLHLAVAQRFEHWRRSGAQMPANQFSPRFSQ
jgi:hypothetical protein